MISDVRRKEDQYAARQTKVLQKGSEYTYWEARFAVGFAPDTGKQIQRSIKTEMQLPAGPCWNNEHDPAFTNALGGFLLYRTVYDCFERIVDRMGKPSTRFCDLRHTYAVMALQSGDDIKMVQENLEHHTAAFTLDVYGHVTDRMKQESANRMSCLSKAFPPDDPVRENTFSEQQKSLETVAFQGIWWTIQDSNL